MATASAAITGARTTTSRSRNPSASTAPITSGVFCRSALARSWFSAAWPPTRAPGGRSPRRRSIVRPVVSARRVGARDGLDQREAARPGLRPEHAGDARDRAGRPPPRPRPRAAARRSGAPRRAGAEGLLQLRVAGPGAVAVRDDLDRRHAGLQPEHGQREHDQHERRGRPEQVRLAPEPLSPARRPRRAVRPRRATQAAAARRSSAPASRARRAAGSASPRARRRR